MTTPPNTDPRRPMNVVIKFEIFETEQSPDKPLASGIVCPSGLLQRAIVYCAESEDPQELKFLHYLCGRAFQQK